MIKIKICGITNIEDAIFVSKFCHLIGVIVNVPVDTPRKIDVEKAREIFSRIKFVQKVVVTMPRDIKDVLEIYRELKPDYIQLHGNESLEFVREIRKRLPCGIIKAITVDDEKSIDVAKKFERYVDAILLDSKKVDYIKGRIHNWNISRKIVESINKPVFLAGGIDDKNVVDALKIVKPYGIDVSSGIEKYPGKKDHKKVFNLYINVQKFLIEEIKSNNFSILSRLS